MRSRLLLATLTLAAPLALALPSLQDPSRQFDFWVGEWSVQNRRIDEAGQWKDEDVTRARITPLACGAALLEEWAGPFRGTFMNGFSLRTFDPAAKEWQLLLFWTTDGNGGFGRLSGAFRHGRGEFFTTRTGPERTRYTFSDALPETVRWDSARTSDGGRSWSTNWIMEFTRTRAASEVTQDAFFASDWAEGSVSPHARARALDWLVGEWRGEAVDAGDRVRTARLRCKTINKGCLFVDVLELRSEDGEDVEQRVAVRGFESASGRFLSWTVGEADPGLRGWLTDVSRPEELRLAPFAPIEGRDESELWLRDGEDTLVIEALSARADAEAAGEPLVLTLTRVARGRE